MRKLTAAVLVLVAVAAIWWWLVPEERAERLQPPTAAKAEGQHGKAARPEVAPSRAAGIRTANTGAEKAARVEKIKRDYDEIRAKAAADFAAQGATFPGGLNGFLKQLALLEREKRKDYAAFLTAEEIEEVEYRDTHAGQMVQHYLRGTAATEEQRRVAFRLQRDFNDRFALTFDLTPAVLLERETARQETQRKVRGVLGEDLFAVWLRESDPNFTELAAFVTQQGLGQREAFGLWEMREEYVRRKLELKTQTLTAQQREGMEAQLAREAEARAVGVLGPQKAAVAQREVLRWLGAK